MQQPSFPFETFHVSVMFLFLSTCGLNLFWYDAQEDPA